jgi:hypothetical protein
VILDILEKSVVAKGCKFSLYALKFIGISIATELEAPEAYSSLDTAKLKYSTNGLS